MSALDATTLELARDLISRESVSPEDGGCQAMMAAYLEALGFTTEAMPFLDVTNLWAVHGDTGPLLVFAGHTDVVPTGPVDEWHTPPFTPTVIDGVLYGRGAADMKGSLAAMLTAAKTFVTQYPEHKGRLALLITSDEEDVAINGTRKVMEALRERGEQVEWCIVGEPSSSEKLGDVVRVGRRGSLSAKLIIKGIQGHVAYPDDASNPIHNALPALAELVAETWDAGNEHFPPTSMQISNINAGTGAGNVIPGSMTLLFNFRFSTESTAESLRNRTEAILDKHNTDYDISWHLSGEPFLTSGGELIDNVQAAITDLLGHGVELSTSGGTSDGRFIAPTGAQLVELGPCNATIHKLNECVRIEELDQLSHVYADIMRRMLIDHG